MKELESKLQDRQVKFAYMLVENELSEDIERKTQNELCEIIGIVPKTAWEWRTKNQNFIEYKNAIADDFLAEKRDKVYSQLMKLITAPNPSVKAISLYLQRQGLLTQKTQIETVNTGEDRGNKSLEDEIAEFDALLQSDDSDE